MRRNWQTIPLVVVVGALAGAAIAGRPTTPPNDVRISAAAAASTTSTTPLPAASVTVASTARAADAPAPTDTDTEVDADAGAAEPIGSEPSGSGAPHTTASRPTTTLSPTTTVRTTTTTLPATQSAPDSTSTAGTPGTAGEVAAPESARGAIRVVVANGTNAAGLARRVADALRAVGYQTVRTDDTRRMFASTVVYFGPGFRSEALRVAADVGVPDDTVLERPSETVTSDDSAADVIVVAGPDRE